MEHKVNSWKSEYNTRQEGEYSCAQGAFRRPAHGVNHLTSSYNVFRPNSFGEMVLNVPVKPNADCSKYVPVGYLTDSTKRSQGKVKQTIANNFVSFSHGLSHSEKHAASAVIESLDFGASYSKSDDSFHRNTQQASKKFVSTSLTGIEDTFTISHVAPPALRDEVLSLIANHLETSQEEHDDAFLENELLHVYPTYLKRAVVGESYAQVRNCFEL